MPRPQEEGGATPVKWPRCYLSSEGNRPPAVPTLELEVPMWDARTLALTAIWLSAVAFVLWVILK